MSNTKINNYITEKLDKIENHLGSQAVSIARLTVSVEDHIKRTNLLEEEIRPIKKHAAMVEGAIKLIAVLGILATVLEAIHVVFK